MMTRLQEAIGLGLILGALHGAAQAVPVVPNFTQGSMTTRTETKQTINETINSMDYSTGYQYSVTGTNVKTTSGQINLPTTQTSNTIDGVTSTWTGLKGSETWVQAKSRRSISVYGNLSGSRIAKSDHHPKRNFSGINNRKYKYLLAVGLIGLLSPSQALANTVGGVSATANPVANSSGSVTNQAIQVLQGPYITNTYGGGIQCQGTDSKLHSLCNW